MSTPTTEAARALLIGLTQEFNLAPFEDVLRVTFTKQAPDLRDVNELARQFARERAGALAQGLKDEEAVAIKRAIAYGLDQGLNDIQIRDRLKTKVGLGPRYAQAVENLRNSLLAKGAVPADANRQARDYAKRLREYRAFMIARTEVMKALNDAQRALWAQQQEMGEISRWAVRIFRVHKDERLCKVCRPLHGRRAALGPKGAYQVPKIGKIVGPPVHPNCRCFEDLVDEGIAKASAYQDLWRSEVQAVRDTGS